MERYTARRPKDPDSYHRTGKIFELFGRDTFFVVLQNLYEKSDPSKSIVDHLIEVAEIKENGLKYEKEKVKELKIKGLEYIQYFDILLLLKIIHATCPKIINKKDEVWTKEYDGKEDIMERKMYAIKETRNKFAHQDEDLVEGDKEQFQKMVDQLITDVRFIVDKSHAMSGKPTEEVDTCFNDIRDGISAEWGCEKLKSNNAYINIIDDEVPVDEMEIALQEKPEVSVEDVMAVMRMED